MSLFSIHKRELIKFLINLIISRFKKDLKSFLYNCFPIYKWYYKLIF